jgi:hypothetical protein
VDVGELGSALADSARHVCDGTTARGPDETEAGRCLPLSQRGLVALDRARADAGAVAGAQLRDEGGVFGDGRQSQSAVGARATFPIGAGSGRRRRLYQRG